MTPEEQNEFFVNNPPLSFADMQAAAGAAEQPVTTALPPEPVLSTGLGNPIITPPVDAGAVKNETADIYNEQDRTAALNTTAANLNAPVDRATSDEFKFRMMPAWRQHLAKNPIRGSLNNMSYEDTLARQRAVDAYNNTPIYMPGHAGGYMSGRLYSSTQATPGQLVRPTPIETEETRRMQTARELDLAAGKLDTERQAEVESYVLNLQKNADTKAQELAYQMGINQDAFNVSWQQAIQKMQYIQPETRRNQMILEQFLTELRLNTNDRIFGKMHALFLDNPIISQMFLELFSPGAITPDLMQYKENEIVSAMMNSDEYKALSPQEQFKALNTAKLMTSYATLQGYSNMFKATAAGTPLKQIKGGTYNESQNWGR